MLEIDGSYGEGGGQILRTAVSLSALTGKDARISNIRANRPKPGLSSQHITAITAVAKLCNAETSELKIGTNAIEFRPGKLEGGNFHFDVLTAGSVTLVLQACIPPSIFAPNETLLKITGGTDVKWAPPIDYLRFVIRPLLNKMGIDMEVELTRRGHYPKGGGEVSVKMKKGSELKPLRLIERGELDTVRGVAHVSNLPNNITQRMKRTALLKLVDFPSVYIVEENYPQDMDPAFGAGAGLVLWGHYENTVLGGSCLGERGLPAEKVGQMAVEALLKEVESQATLDIYATDQLLPYMALVNGESIFLTRELSHHAKTNMWLIEQFLGAKFEVRDRNEIREVKVRDTG